MAAGEAVPDSPWPGKESLTKRNAKAAIGPCKNRNAGTVASRLQLFRAVLVSFAAEFSFSFITVGNIMKKIAIAAAALIMGSMSASAADLAARPYTKAPVAPIAVYNWGGFYIGGHVGGAWTNQEWVNTANTTLFGDLGPGQGFRQRGTGVFGGGQIGYNWQASNFVFGLEGTISGLETRGSVLNTVFGTGLDDLFSWRADWMATITG